MQKPANIHRMQVRSLCAGITLGIAACRPAVAVPGAVDAGFNPNANFEVFALSMQPDGKIVAGGTFTTIAGISRPFMALKLSLAKPLLMGNSKELAAVQRHYWRKLGERAKF